MSMFSQIKASIEKFPERNAFYINNRFYNYKAFAEKLASIYNELKKKGLSKELVGILTNDDLETYAAIFAVLFSGNAFVPLNPKNPKERNMAIIEQAGLKLVVTTHDGVDEMLDCKNIEIVDMRGLPVADIDFSVPEICENDIAYLLFTSGSTGVPKGVPIVHKNLAAFIHGFFALGYELDENDRFLQMFDLSFDLSVMSYVIPLCLGACCYTIPSDGIQYTFIYQLFIEHELTFALMVPSILSHLRPFFGEIKLEKMRYSPFCGEALYEDITSEWAKCVPNTLVQNVYGPTEATIFCLAYDWKNGVANKSFNGIVCIGKEMADVKAIIVDENNCPVATCEKGELCLGGGQTTPGYWNNPEKNKEAFFTLEGEQYYKTGDIAFVDNEGDFFFLGRKDHQVKVQGGYRVELSEIEHYAREFLGSNNVAAISMETDIGIAKICLAIENFGNDFSDLKAFMKKHLPHYMIPNKFISFDTFPLNVNGKTDRKKLKNLIQEGKIG